MLKRFLKSSTSAAVCVAIALPGPALSQGNSLYGVAEGGEVVPNPGALNTRPCEVLTAIRADVPESLNPDVVSSDLALDGLSDDECRELLTLALETTEPEEAAEAEEPAPAEDATAEETAAEEQAPAEEEVVVNDLPQVEAEPEGEASAEAQAEPETAAETVVEEAAEPVESSDEPVAAAEPSDAGNMSAGTTVEAADGTTDEPPAASDDTPAPEPEIVAVDEAAPAEEAAPQEPEVAQTDTEESAARANETVSAAAAAEDAEAEGEVTTEVVTEETSRSSGEEFASRVEMTESKDGKRSDDGLTNLEKFALGALGAIVVGNILSQGDEVVSASEDRAVVRRDDGNLYVLKDDNTLLRQPGSTVETQSFADGSTVQTVTREDGSQVVTVRAANGQVLRRTRILPDGLRVVLFDDTQAVEPVEVSELPEAEDRAISLEDLRAEELRRAILAEEARRIDRGFSLQQIRQIRAVRSLVPTLEVDAVTFASGSAVIEASEARELSDLALAMIEAIEDNPAEVFLIEGHTDAVGSAAMNLALSDRRAESVALALTEFFDVPPENMVVQGYGESNLKIPTQEAERENRRVTVRRITTLLAQGS